ncbi:hypothetical protein B0H13DRAFT_2314884 [Mycena leptocephala]|nr:hypothetical protein B0H13DRAFT_2314884 [Mycena leptocephala]
MPSRQPLSSDDESESFLPKPRDPSLGARTWITRVSLSVNLFLLVVSMVFLARPLRQSPQCPVDLYSPAQDAISYSPVVFHHSSTSSPTKYRGYGRNVDEAWQELYSVGPSIITENEAKKLLNWTQPLQVAGQETHSILLAVFHDLHCVNLARMSLYPDHYKSPALKAVLTPHHLNHCLDMLRQTIQCSADVTPLPARLESHESSLMINYPTDAERMCRDFGKVKEWASARQGTDEFRKVLLST